MSTRTPLLSDDNYDAVSSMLNEVMQAVASGELSAKKAANGLAQFVHGVDCGAPAEIESFTAPGLKRFVHIT